MQLKPPPIVPGFARARPACARLAPQAGVGLLDALIALAILAFGLLALTQMQTRLAAAVTESSARLLATQMADELASRALVDPEPNNVGCYTIPLSAPCGNAAASGLTTAWLDTLPGRMPGTAPTATATYTAASGQLEVQIRWTGKGSTEPRTISVVTDVRP
jgi:type IV pilus assembly protein PilV